MCRCSAMAPKRATISGSSNSSTVRAAQLASSRPLRVLVDPSGLPLLAGLGGIAVTSRSSEASFGDSVVTCVRRAIAGVEDGAQAARHRRAQRDSRPVGLSVALEMELTALAAHPGEARLERRSHRPAWSALAIRARRRGLGHGVAPSLLVEATASIVCPAIHRVSNHRAHPTDVLRQSFVNEAHNPQDH